MHFFIFKTRSALNILSSMLDNQSLIYCFDDGKVDIIIIVAMEKASGPPDRVEPRALEQLWEVTCGLTHV